MSRYVQLGKKKNKTKHHNMPVEEILSFYVRFLFFTYSMSLPTVKYQILSLLQDIFCLVDISVVESCIHLKGRLEHIREEYRNVSIWKTGECSLHPIFGWYKFSEHTRSYTAIQQLEMQSFHWKFFLLCSSNTSLHHNRAHLSGSFTAHYKINIIW